MPRSRSHLVAVGVLAGGALVAGLLALLPGAGTMEASSVAADLDQQPAPSTTASAPAPTRSAAARMSAGYYAAPIGMAFTYTLRGQCEYSLGHPEGGRQASGFGLQGQFEVTIGDRHDDAIALQVAVRELRLSPLSGAAAGDSTAFVAALQQPFFVQLATDGAVRGYRFADALNGEQRNFARGLFAAYAHRVAADAQGTWEAEDIDAAGKFVARFELSADGDSADATVVSRTKLRYLEMTGDELHAHRLTGGSRATFSAEHGWLHDVDMDERTSLTMAELGLQIDAHTRFAFAFAGARAAALAVDFVALRDATWQPAAGHREDHAATAEGRDREKWSKRLAGTSLSALCDALAQLLAAKPQDPQAIDEVFQSLIWLVRLQPEVAGEIAQRVRAGVEAALGDVLLSALGAAGTLPAQDVLADFRRDAGVPAAVRTSATVALFQTAAPTARVLGEIASDIQGAAELTGDSAMAMLLLGTLAPRAGDAQANGRAPFAALLDLEAKAQGEGRTDLWLNALGNAGTDDVVPHAERHMQSESELVRGAAYHALRRVETPRALALLERGAQDPAAGVRADAVGALAEHRSEAAGAALARAARDDTDPAVRRAALPGLARLAAKNQAARRALEHVAGADPDAENQKAAKAILAGLR